MSVCLCLKYLESKIQYFFYSIWNFYQQILWCCLQKGKNIIHSIQGAPEKMYFFCGKCCQLLIGAGIGREWIVIKHIFSGTSCTKRLFKITNRSFKIRGIFLLSLIYTESNSWMYNISGLFPVDLPIAPQLWVVHRRPARRRKQRCHQCKQFNTYVLKFM